MKQLYCGREILMVRVADMLRHPDDLTNKLPMLRKKIAMERASVEAQLKTIMEVQLDSMQKGLDTVRESKVQTENIKKSLLQMDSLCGEEKNAIKNYLHIRRVSIAHQNFQSTKALVETFVKINEQMARCMKLLEEDSKRILGPAENLLLIHHFIQWLSDFRSRIVLCII